MDWTLKLNGPALVLLLVACASSAYVEHRSERAWAVGGGAGGGVIYLNVT